MVSVSLFSDDLLQHLPSYLGFLTLDMGYLFTAAPAKRSRCSLLGRVAPPDLECGVAPLSHSSCTVCRSHRTSGVGSLSLLQGIFPTQGWTQVSRIAGGFFTSGSAREALSKCYLLSRARLFVTPWTAAHQVPLSMRFSRQGYWSGLPVPSPGNLPNPGIFPTQGSNSGLL